MVRTNVCCLIKRSTARLSVVSKSTSLKQHRAPIWDDFDWHPLPELKGTIETDVCVVGLGGSGLACIMELMLLGQKVVGVDAGCLAGGAAGRNGGFLLAGLADFYHVARQSLGAARSKSLYNMTLTELDRMSEETPHEIRRTGSLRIAVSKEEEADCMEQYNAMVADGLPVELYNGPEGVGLLFPPDGSYNPIQRCRTLAKRALVCGARLYEHSPAVVEGNGIVRTPHGVVKCKKIIVAVDGRLERMFPELNGRVWTARLQMLATAPTTEVKITRPVYARHGFEYWQQLPNGSIALGGFRDKGGDDEWTDETDPSPAVQSLLEDHLRCDVGVRDATITHRWAASVGMTNTVLPIFEEVRQDVWAIGGYNGTGNIVGSLCGRAVARRAVLGTSAVAKQFAAIM